MVIDFKTFGRLKAREISTKLGICLVYVGFDGKRFFFQHKRWKAIKIIDMAGNVEREPFISDKWVPSSECIYSEIACYPRQLDDGDLEFLIANGMTQNEHERFETGE